MPTFTVELWGEPHKVPTTKTEDIEADEYVIEASGALTFRNTEKLPVEGLGSMTSYLLVKAFSPWAWASIVKRETVGG